MNLKKNICIAMAVIFSITSFSAVSAGKYDAVIEKAIFKKAESKRLAYIDEINTVLMQFEEKIAAKLQGEITESKQTSYNNKLALIDEVQDSLAVVKNKILAANAAETITAEPVVVETPVIEETSANIASVSGTYFEGKKTLQYIVDFNEVNGPILEQREEYIQAALDQGYTQQDANDAADLFIGKAPLSVDQGVATLELNIQNKDGITGEFCQNMQSINGIEKECEEDIYRSLTYNYDATLSAAIGYDVYAEYSANELQINRYLVDYKPGTLVYVKYGVLPMNSQSSYFEADIFTTSVENASNFNEDEYLELAKAWNSIAVEKVGN